MKGFKPFKYEREYINLADGGLISLDWAYPLIKCDKKGYKEVTDAYHAPIFFIVHGLTGGSNKDYI